MVVQTLRGGNVLATGDQPEDGRLVLRQLETEMSDARQHVLRCRAAGNEKAAQLHVVWMDLPLEEWSRCSLTAQQFWSGEQT